MYLTFIVKSTRVGRYCDRDNCLHAEIAPHQSLRQ